MIARAAAEVALTVAAAVALALPSSAAADGYSCLRTSTIPAPPPDGAVFARAPDPSNSEPNVVVIDGHSYWPGGCGSDVMNHPTTITVAPGGAVLLYDSDHGVTRYSAWGAVDVTPADPPPNVAPDTYQ